MESLYWVGLAAGAPFLWAIVNHIDKYFLSERFSHAKVGITGGLMIFSTLFSIVVLPILYVIDPQSILSAHFWTASMLVLIGVLHAFSILLYLQALDMDEASIVVPIFQTIPIFGFIFGYLILGEVLTPYQMFGALLVVLFSVLLTLELDKEKGVRFKKKVLLLMFASSALLALVDTLFKLGAEDKGSVVGALFWENVGLLIFGIVLLFAPTYRKSFNALLKHNFKTIFSLNIVSEGLTVIGNVMLRYALMLAPIALVMTIGSIQPLYVFALGILLTLFFPRISKENMSRHSLIQKTVSILFIALGAGIITFYS